MGREEREISERPVASKNTIAKKNRCVDHQNCFGRSSTTAQSFAVTQSSSISILFFRLITWPNNSIISIYPDATTTVFPGPRFNECYPDLSDLWHTVQHDKLTRFHLYSLSL